MKTFQYTGTLTPHQVAEGLAQEVDGELFSQCSVSTTGVIYYPDDFDIETAILGVEQSPPPTTCSVDLLSFREKIMNDPSIETWLSGESPTFLYKLVTATTSETISELIKTAKSDPPMTFWQVAEECGILI